MPFTEVPGLVGTERLPQRRPHAVGAHRVRSTDRSESVDLELDPSVDEASIRQGVAVVHFRPCGPGHVEQGGVEISAFGHGCEDPLTARHGEAHGAPRGRPHPHVVDGLPRGDGLGSEAERLQVSQGARCQSVAAALVARKPRPVDHDDVAACSGQDDGGSRTGRAAADHDDVGLQHDPRLLVRAAAKARWKPVRGWPVCLS